MYLAASSMNRSDDDDLLPVANRKASSCKTEHLLFKHLFNLAHFLLDFAGNFFVLTFFR
jgi:hypothetical protein